jgi:hypothetical protein
MATAMDRIATQEIPQAVIDDPRVDWDPVKNVVRLAPASEVEERPATQVGRGLAPAVASVEREPDTRYATLLATFRAAQRTDQDSPFAPTEIDRRFRLDYELPEARVRALFEQLLASPLIPRLAALVQKRLGRPLEPHDLWYAGFLERARFPEAQLDARTRKRYPDPAAYHRDMPRLLRALGFTPQKAAWLSERIVVDPARGAGHALGSARRGDFPHLRTRISPGGMDYKGYNIAVHLRAATVAIARAWWNRHYAPVLGGKDSALLAVYSHMVSSFLYLPAYPLGRLIAFQLEQTLQGPKSGAASFGRVTPDFWMEHATGSALSAEPLLRAAEDALRAEEGFAGVAPR